MLSPFVSWILPSPSSSSTSSDEEETIDVDIDINSDEEGDYGNDNNEDEEDDHFLSSSEGDGDGGGDGTIPVALAIPDAQASASATPKAAKETSILDNNRNITTNVETRPKRQRISYSGSGRQYQRLWTKQNEMELLKGYLDYIKQQRWETTSLPNDVALSYDHIRPKLNTGFNRNQLVEKLRRLKRKYKNNLGKDDSFKSPQERAIFEISHKIWGNDRRDQDALDDEDDEPSPIPDTTREAVDHDHEMENRVLRPRKRVTPDDVNRTNDHNNEDATPTTIQKLIEETMTSCFPPLVKELLDNVQEGSCGGLAPDQIPLSLCDPSTIDLGSGEGDNEQWRKRRILELEVYLKRLALLQDQIKAKLEELRSS